MNETIVSRHIALLMELAKVTNSGITLYDNLTGKHVFTSYNFANLFRYDLDEAARQDSSYFTLKIHPDDLVPLDRNGQRVFAFIGREENTADRAHMKLINEYRIRIDNQYMRVIEQFQIVEFTPEGNIWLTLSVLDISPNQVPLERVESKLMNCRTGKVWNMEEIGGPDDLAEETSKRAHPGEILPLSAREKTILRMASEGLLSKEISDQLSISVHTVNTHRQRILKKLQANNTVEAIHYASRLGLLE